MRKKTHSATRKERQMAKTSFSTSCATSSHISSDFVSPPSSASTAYRLSVFVFLSSRRPSTRQSIQKGQFKTDLPRIISCIFLPTCVTRLSSRSRSCCYANGELYVQMMNPWIRSNSVSEGIQNVIRGVRHPHANS